MKSRLFAGTGIWMRFILRRERITSLIWLFALVFMTMLVPVLFQDMYSVAADRQAIALSMDSPAMIAMLGPNYGRENYTVGVMFANEMLAFSLIAVAVMNINLVVRHTRGDEEQGRIEMIRALPIGRLANVSAVLMVALILNGVLGAAIGIGLSTLGIESMHMEFCMLYGTALGIAGMFFAAAAALFAQLCGSARGVMGVGYVFMGMCYMLRAVGDINNETLARISPMGLLLRTQVFVQNHWWPVWIIAALAILVTFSALGLNAIRDMDQGFIPARPGRRQAPMALSSPMGLAWRLLRDTLAAWMIGMFVLGAAYGSIMGDLEAFLNGNELLSQMLNTSSGHTLTEMFITMLMSVQAITATVPTLTVLLKLRGEEQRGRLEHLLTRPVSRVRLLLGYLGMACAVSVAVLFAAMCGLWSAGAAVMEVPPAFGGMCAAMMVYLPALWVMVGVAALLTGIAPRCTGIVWGYLGFSFLSVYMGGLLQWPDWVKLLTPFGHIPQLPAEDVRISTLAILTGIAILLAGVGLAGFRHRDIT